MVWLKQKKSVTFLQAHLEKKNEIKLYFKLTVKGWCSTFATFHTIKMKILLH